LNLKLPLE